MPRAGCFVAVLILLIFLVVAASALVWALVAHKLVLPSPRELVLAAQPGTVADAVEGKPLRLVGEVSAQGAPLLGVIEPVAEYVARTVQVSKAVRMGRGRWHLWWPVASETGQVPLELDTGERRVEIRARHVGYADRDVRRAGKEVLWQETRVFDALLERHGRDAAHLARAPELDVREQGLRVGQLVEVLGTVRWEDDPDGTLATDGYRGATRARRLVLVDATVVVNEGVPTSG